MAVVPVTLTVEPQTQVTTPANSRVRITVLNNAGGAIIDTATDEILLGNFAEVVSAGVATEIELAPTNAATNPTGFQYKVLINYIDQSQRRRVDWDSGWFSLTADANLGDMVAEQYVPPTYMSTAVETLQGYIDQAEAITGLETVEEAVALAAPPIVEAEVTEQLASNPDVIAAAADYAAAGLGVLTAGSAPALDTTRVPDPQLKTAGSASASFTLSRITTGLPSGFVYGIETARAGTPNSVIAQITLAPAASSQADALRIPVSVGEVISARVQAWTDQASAMSRLDLAWYNASGAIISTSAGTYTNIAASTWETRSRAGVTAPAGTAYVAPILAVSTQSGGNTVVGAKARVTGLAIAAGTTVPAYADGTTSGWAWTGTAHASTAKKVFHTPTGLAAAAVAAVDATKSLTVTKSGNTFTVGRSLNGSTLTQTFTLTGGANGGFDLTSTTLGGTSIHDTSDDTTPIRTQNDTIGGDHGFNFVRTFTNPDGKTTADVGSVWTDGTRQYVLLAIQASKPVFGGSYATDGSGVVTSAVVAPTANLTHVSGATHAAAVDYTTGAATQLRPGGQYRVVATVWADGKQLTADGIYACATLVVRETYEVPDYASMYDLSKANIGTAVTSLAVAGAVRVGNVWTWTSTACLVDTTLTELKPTTLAQCGSIQSAIMAKAGATVTRYLPGVNAISGKDFTAGVDMTSWSSNILVTTGDLKVTGRPPVLSLDVLATSGVPEVGFAQGYLPDGHRGTEASTSATRVTHAPTILWDLRDTKKNYPTWTTSEAAGWGTKRTAAFRAYLDPTQIATALAAKGDALTAWEAFSAATNLGA